MDQGRHCYGSHSLTLAVEGQCISLISRLTDTNVLRQQPKEFEELKIQFVKKLHIAP